VRWRGSFEASVHDVSDDAFQIGSDILGRHPDSFDSLLPEPTISPLIPAWRIAKLVDNSTDIGCDSGRLAEEVQHKGTKRMLSPKLQSVRAQSKKPPGPNL
jgi:hypothetical protein